MLHKKTLILSVLCLLFIHSYSQDRVLFKPITVIFNNVSIDSALNIIENEINFNFTYNSVYTYSEKKIRAHFTQIPLSIILDSLFNNPFLTYKIIDKQLVIYKEEPESDNISQSITEEIKAITTLSITGSIVDLRSNNPIPFAAVGFKNSNEGTISNHDGKFILTYDSTFLNDTLLISHLGYAMLTIPVKQLETIHTYKLQQQSISLQEVIIRSTDPRSLVRQALNKRFDNYDMNPFIHRAFYRETIKRNDRYMVYTEALFDIFKSAYRPTIFNDQLKLIKQRKFTDVNSRDTVLFKLHGGLSTSLLLDVLKHPIDFLDEDHINEYNYFVRDVILIENKLAYLIEFKPQKETNDMAFRGEIYIDLNTMAIVKVNFNFTRESIKKLKNSFIIKQSKAIRAHPIEAEYGITYKKHQNGLYYINHIKGCLRLKVKKKRKLLASNYETSFEMITTDLNTVDVSRFSRKETIDSRRVFSELGSRYNAQYWFDENFILPEDDLSKALLRLKQEDLSIQNK